MATSPAFYVGTEAQRTASTAVPSSRDLVVTSEGRLFFGDGSSQARNLPEVVSRPWRGNTNFATGEIVRLPTGELATVPSTFTSHATNYLLSALGTTILWAPLVGAGRTRARTREAIRKANRKQLKRVAVPVNTQLGTTTTAIGAGTSNVTSIGVSLTTAIAPGVFRVVPTGGGIPQTFYTATGIALGTTTATFSSTGVTNALPSGSGIEQGFSWPADLPLPNLYFDGHNYSTDFDARKLKNTSTTQWYLDSVEGWGYSNNTGKQVTTLTTSITLGSTITSLAIAALGATLGAGTIVLLSTDDQGVLHKQTFITSGSGSGSTTLGVNSTAVTYSFPAGTLIVSPRTFFADIMGLSGFAAGDTINVLDRKSNSLKGLVFQDRAGFYNAAITKSINIIAAFPGEPTYVNGISNLAWTATSGQAGVYQAAQNCVRVIDIGPTYSPRTGEEYVNVGSIAAVKATPGSWYYDGTNTYMQTVDGTAPNPLRHLGLVSSTSFWVTSPTAEVDFYAEGLDILGGQKGNLTLNPSGNRIRSVCYNVGFLWAASSGKNAPGVMVAGAYQSVLQKCYVVGAEDDNIAYHGSDSTSYGATSYEQSNAIEIDCVSHSAGFFGGALAPAIATTPNANATTSHINCKVIRIGGIYYGGGGTPVADVQNNNQTLDYSCIGFDSDCPAGNPGLDSSFSTQQALAEKWVFSCIGFGSQHGDMYLAPQSVVHADRCQFDQIMNTYSGGDNGLYLETNPA